MMSRWAFLGRGHPKAYWRTGPVQRRTARSAGAPSRISQPVVARIDEGVSINLACQTIEVLVVEKVFYPAKRELSPQCEHAGNALGRGARGEARRQKHENHSNGEVEHGTVEQKRLPNC